MNKHELAKAFSIQTGLTFKSSQMYVDVIFGLMSEELIKGNPILLTGFGRLYLHKRSPRKRINFSTGTFFDNKGNITVRFKPCDYLYRSLNKE